MKSRINIICTLILLIFIIACEDKQRSDLNDSIPPGPPSNITYKPLYGGARFFYDVPDDEDVLSVEARYTNADGKTFAFAASYFVDSLDVIGFGDTIQYTVELCALDRAGNRSVSVPVQVVPLESTISRVTKSIQLKSGFSSFFVDWVNELEQSINVYVDFSYTQAGNKRSFTSVFSSNLKKDRRFVENLPLGPEDPLQVKIRIADIYGNMSDPIDMGEITLLEDIKIPKDNWFLPAANDSIGGVPQAFGDNVEGRLRYIIDGNIDEGENLNFMHTGGRGRTGKSSDGNMPWNVIIDLGDHYELSRIVTVQRHTNFCGELCRGQYYRDENVGLYEMYAWDDDTKEWVFISEHKIPVPVGLSDLEIVKKGRQGDMAYMYPDEPRYTKPTRWFRYRAMKSFNGNYTLDNANCLSELTLYGRKAAR